MAHRPGRRPHARRQIAHPHTTGSQSRFVRCWKRGYSRPIGKILLFGGLLIAVVCLVVLGLALGGVIS